jgi:peptidoglycan/LPS O-acetylase OafA/YrhL
MYIFHLVAKREGMVPIVQSLMRVGLPLSVSVVLAMVICSIAVYAFALLTWYGFEMWFLKLKDRFQYDVPANTQLTVASGASE